MDDTTNSNIGSNSRNAGGSSSSMSLSSILVLRNTLQRVKDEAKAKAAEQSKLGQEFMEYDVDDEDAPPSDQPASIAGAEDRDAGESSEEAWVEASRRRRLFATIESLEQEHHALRQSLRASRGAALTPIPVEGDPAVGKVAGISEDELARVLGVSTPTATEVETGTKFKGDLAAMAEYKERVGTTWKVRGEGVRHDPFETLDWMKLIESTVGRSRGLVRQMSDLEATLQREREERLRLRQEHAAELTRLTMSLHGGVAQVDAASDPVLWGDEEARDDDGSSGIDPAEVPDNSGTMEPQDVEPEEEMPEETALQPSATVSPPPDDGEAAILRKQVEDLQLQLAEAKSTSSQAKLELIESQRRNADLNRKYAELSTRNSSLASLVMDAENGKKGAADVGTQTPKPKDRAELQALRQRVRVLESEKARMVEIVKGFDPPTTRQYMRAVPAEEGDSAFRAVAFAQASPMFDRPALQRLVQGMAVEEIRLRRLQAKDSLGLLRAVGHHMYLLNSIASAPFAVRELRGLQEWVHTEGQTDSVFDRILAGRAPVAPCANIVRRLQRHVSEYQSRRAVFEALHYREINRLLTALSKAPSATDMPKYLAPLGPAQLDRLELAARGLAVDFGGLQPDTRASLLGAVVEYAVSGSTRAIDVHPLARVTEGFGDMTLSQSDVRRRLTTPASIYM
ncbi:hypothetical protein J8273_5667 [Carpediemonas membranifera]|uniref:Uncharacterized protein n=1 Tax=Carpediemonas membranifera TaxID=201153 RepID=A0A8J6B4X6_9EUKA|nr:hypothetical protein J8273_5667 [Carpediemonas membranifera]|eukprot:KAG9392957.1 hypothetical protein J8273_5667 [Carpediemonas membranifera]